jgi:hypothetical protein
MSPFQQSTPMPGEERIRYVPESPAVDYRIVILAAIASLLLVAFAIGVLNAIYQRSVRIKDVPAPQAFSQPRVAPSQAEAAERVRLASEQRRRLETWQWANPEHTLVQIPIERAMQILAQRGNDAWAPLLLAPTVLSSPTSAAQNATTSTSAGTAPTAEPRSGDRP